MWREWRGENSMGYVVGRSVNICNILAEWWQRCTVAAKIGQHLAFEKSILQRLWRCGGSGGVRIEWGMW